MESKVYDNLDSLIHDVSECKRSIELLLAKLSGHEHQQQYSEKSADWPEILNSLRIISTDLISITKFVKSNRDFGLRSSIIVPKHCSEEIDAQLRESTAGRMLVFNQDLIPNILRTKLIPPLEESEFKYYDSAKEFEQVKTFDKNISQLKKTIDDSANMIEKPKRDTDQSRCGITTFNYQDTWQLTNVIVNLSHGVGVARGANVRQQGGGASGFMGGAPSGRVPPSQMS